MDAAHDTLRDIQPNTIDTLYVLPRQLDVEALREWCRETALEFLNNSAQWSKLDLVLWLTGPYDQLAGHSAHCVANRSLGPSSAPSLHTASGVHVVDGLMAAARAEAIDAFRAMLANGNVATFAFRAVANGHVVPCEDRRGEQGYSPVGRADLSLADRVLSLLAADYLMSPQDYETVHLCERCHHVSINARACTGRRCAVQFSGIYLRRETSWPAPPLEAA